MADYAEQSSKDGGRCFEVRELTEEIVGEFQGCGGDVVFEVGDGGCAGNGKHHAGAGEEPGERDLHGSGAEFSGDTVEEVVGLAILAEGSPGDEGDAEFFAVVEEVVPLAVGEAVAVLDGDDGDDFASALEVFEGDVG